MPTEPTNLCRTGSGRKCKGTFAPGGDATYKSRLIDRILGGHEPSDVERKERTKKLANLGYDDDHIQNHDPELVTVKRAEAIIHERNWDHFLARKRAIVAGKIEKAKERQKAQDEAKRLKAEAEKAEKAEADKAAKADKATKVGAGTPQ